MKKLRFFLLLCISLSLTGCAPNISPAEQQPDGAVHMGKVLRVEPPAQLTLSESNDALAAEGLYYATWVDGDSVPYENSDNETIELYDAQLYLLAGEAPDSQTAQSDCDAWLAAARENYEVYAEDTIICNGQSYTLISYNCTGDTTPYNRGISVFGVHDTVAVCIELTCLEHYSKELEPILTEFLNGCHYSTD